jgi:hypothetical protein
LLLIRLAPASANLRPTKLNIFASIPSRDFTSAQLHPSRSQIKPSFPRVSHTSSSGTHPSHPFWIQLCGLNCGTTPSARDDGRIDTLWVASAAEWRPLQEPRRPSKTHNNRCQNTLSTLHYSSDSRPSVTWTKKGTLGTAGSEVERSSDKC